MKTLIIAFIASWCSLAQAAVSRHDLTGVWWNPREPGWAVTMHQQGEVIIATLLIYAANGRAQWYTAALRPRAGSTLYYFEQDYEGDLYAARGPALGTPDFASSVSRTRVGRMRISSDNLSANLAFDVEGLGMGASLERYTWDAVDLTGTYDGIVESYPDSCDGPFGKSTAGALVVHQSGESVRMSLGGASESCDITASYSANGRLGSIISGTATCRDGGGATSRWAFSADEVQLTDAALILRYSFAPESSHSCGTYGAIVGARPSGRQANR